MNARRTSGIRSITLQLKKENYIIDNVELSQSVLTQIPSY
jgi:hypothetical protein